MCTEAYLSALTFQQNMSRSVTSVWQWPVGKALLKLELPVLCAHLRPHKFVVSVPTGAVRPCHT